MEFKLTMLYLLCVILFLALLHVTLLLFLPLIEVLVLSSLLLCGGLLYSAFNTFWLFLIENE